MGEIKTTDYIFDIDKDEEYNYTFLELPIFNRDRKIGEGVNKRYVFDEKNESYVEVKTSYFEEDGEYRNLNEFDEKIFYALIKLYWETRNDLIITDYFEILRTAKIAYNGATFKRVAEGMQRLLKTNIVINNIKGLKNQTVNVLTELKVLERDADYDVTDEQKEIAAKFFRNSKIKRILLVKLNPMIMEELKKIDVENLNILLRLNAKKIYVLIQKWFEYTRDLSYEKRFADISAFLPFNWSKTSVGRTIKYIADAFEELKYEGMIRKYEVVKLRPNSESYIKFQINERFFSTGDKDLESKNYHESLKKIIKESNLFLKEFTREIKKIAKMVALNESMLKKEMLSKIFTKIHTIKGIAKYIRFEEVWALADEIEKRVDNCINGEGEFSLELINGVGKLIDKIQKICEGRY